MTMANEEAKYTFNWSEKMATLSKVVTTMAQAMKYKRVMLEPCLITDDIIRPTDAWMVGVCWCVLGVRWGVFSWNQSMMGQWEGGCDGVGGMRWVGVDGKGGLFYIVKKIVKNIWIIDDCLKIIYI